MFCIIRNHVKRITLYEKKRKKTCKKKTKIKTHKNKQRKRELNILAKYV